MGDNNSLLEFYLELYCGLFGDLARLHPLPTGPGFDRDYLTVVSRCKQEGISFLTKGLPLLGKALDKSLASGKPLDIPGWRKQPGTVLPVFLGRLWSSVFSPCGDVLASADTMAVRSLRQVCFLLYKLKLPSTNEQNQKVIADFVQVDKDLGHYFDRGLDHEAEVLVDLARAFLARVTCSFDPYDITPRHGPGVVSTGEKPWEKMRFKRFYPGIDEVYPYSEYFFFNASHLCDELQTLDQLEVHPHGCAKVVLVPKDSRGPRLISCEPLEYQWMQQGLGRALVKHVESHRLTSGHVNFTSQEVNRRLALAGSVDRRYVTLDMKEASDRVSLKLVESLFEPRIFRALKALRSSYTRTPNGQIVPLNKFAPMGSALCFPVESLVFFALSVAILHRHRHLDYFTSSRRVWVYGDDLIVHFEDYEVLLQHLPRFGLMLNEGKCCTEGFFRESCGVDAFRGVDVTPLKIRSVWASGGAGYLVSYVQYSNWLYANGYPSTAACIVPGVERVLGPLPFSNSRDTPYLAWLTYCGGLTEENAKRCRFRYNRKLQRRELLGWAARGATRSGPADGWSEVLRMHSLNETYDSEHYVPGTYAVPHRINLQRGWSGA